MKWRGRRQSGNIEDRRGRGGGGMVRMGGGGGLLLIAIVIIGSLLGFDMRGLLNGMMGSQMTGGSSTEITEQDQVEGEFVATVLAETDDLWTEIFADQLNADYPEPTLVLFKGVTQSPCGNASGATGPFYCPGDNKVYLDTSFFTTLRNRMGAGGDFAAAYVVAHEVAHHVQNVTGTLQRANQQRARVSERESNAISVRIELQADCLSGVWARHAEDRGLLEEGDLGEAINAAKQIGDDVLQANAGRTPSPHTFTHGTSEQRQRWFARGYEEDDIRACDTFSPGYSQL
ncbi:neutral zinc metallopeptidase [Paracoccaceae bacterium GXU_MW_L88]